MTIDTHRVPRRDEIPVEHTWNLTLIYASDAAWEEAVVQLEQQLPEIAALQGTLSQSAQSLLHMLQLQDDVFIQLYEIYRYASHRKDSDSSDPAGQALEERAGSVVARASTALSFVEPEILTIPGATITQWLQEEDALHRYDYALQQLLQKREHIRSAEVEGILAEFSDITRAPNEIYDVLTNADLRFPSIHDEAGHLLELSHARYGRLMESKDRRVRHDAFKGMYQTVGGVQSTLGTILAAEVRSHAINARVRNYQSALEAALKPHDIPVDVYHNLIATIHNNLPLLHRYMALRKRLMGLDELRMYDLYVPNIAEAEVLTPYSEATEIIKNALAPLGPDYAEALQRSFTNRWIDVYENVGKRSGAYSGGSYTTAPFILMNYQDRLTDMFTLAHELGHSMHSYFTWRTQPFVYGNYTIFVAEVASTLNESLLVHYLINNRDDEALRKRLIVQQLEDIRTTIFRQTMFAEFELDMHTRVEAGEPLTADVLSKRYYDLVGRYHGAEVVLDDEIALEWARIPHFYYNFYVYQYATGLSAALALSKQIINEGQPAVERYLTFLQSGSSKSSIDLLRDAGVDMTTPEPIQAAMNTFGELLDQMEQLQ
ncbi:MAG: oligoendopeptidase F [Chloroflexi bacterium AL-W]|nr:oligoendopeptidase F [Chloroflexi bacterium AL-N1]NOK68316.1 oligoendopeptidase F [Chloroflexi bacterium AL-N10]NOK73962.1 oligoendopeptidase F [Chloroflexi bacterium AL-N5]NOK82930.1 oligoendopeptidase F [Chloroflexi bacterium AL-W]NOK90452.1 oligoendopeptidase F [Chloroflexi bacterium AL-N15]